MEEVDQPPQTYALGGEEYTYLGTDALQSFHHYYRFTPAEAQVVWAAENDMRDELTFVDSHHLEQGDPRHAVQEYKHDQRWDAVQDVEHHDFYSVSDPVHNPDLNSELEGSLLLDDGDYVLPLRSRFGDAYDIIQDQAAEADELLNQRPDYFELAPEDAITKYRFTGFHRAQPLTSDKILDEVSVVDRGSNEVYDTWHVDDLARDHFRNQLAQIEFVSPHDADEILDTYHNLRTTFWACTSDQWKIEDLGYDPMELWGEAGEVGIYRNENSPESGPLHMPERKAKDMTEAQQERYFDSVIHPQEEDEGYEMPGEQGGLDDF